MASKSFGPSRLVGAIRAGQLGGVIAALDDGAEIEEADFHGFAGLPLRTACFEGDPAIVRALLERGADIDGIAGDGPAAPLRLALRGGHRDIAALLLGRGAQVPPGLAIDPALYDVAVSPESPPTSPPPEIAPEPATAPGSELPPPALAEPLVDQLADHLIEEVDIQSSYGVDTNLLTMDLMRFNEDQDAALPERPAAAAAPRKSFWKSGRSG